MNEANYASLSAGLLARKGQAKPAMRPQSYNFGGDDDLGWNDMGGADMLTPEQRLALLPAQPGQYAQPHPAYDFDVAVPSPASEQQHQIASAFEAEAAPVVEQPAAAVPTGADRGCTGDADPPSARRAGIEIEGCVYAAPRPRAASATAAGVRLRTQVGAADRDRCARRISLRELP